MTAQTPTPTQAQTPIAMVLLASETQEFGLVPAADAKTQAKALAKEHKASITGRDPITDEVVFTVKPAAAPKAAKAPAAKAPKAPAAKAPAAKAPKEPKEPKATKASDAKASMADALVALAMRPEGVSPAELNEVSKWNGAPWRWLFSNWQKTGWCDRRGLGFEVIKGEGRRVAYHVTKG